MAEINSLNSPTITLLAGPKEDPTPFSVHECLLISRSQNIANALKPDRWREGTVRIISFNEKDPQTFAEYLEFVVGPAPLGGFVAEVTAETFDDDYTKLCSFYVLSDMLMDKSMNT